MLEWDKTGARIFEAGVDRGVLYVGDKAGVAWNGLVSVIDRSQGEAPTSYYAEGIKYLVSASLTDFEATIQALTYPDEFEACDGTQDLSEGIGVTQQEPQPFGMCYRTLLGNDISGIDLGYKLHLVYNALVKPTDRTYATQTENPTLTPFSWDIVTTPEFVTGMRPSAHIVLDSRKLDPEVLAAIESILYGAADDPKLPSPDELGNIFADFRFIIVIASPDPSLLPDYAEDGDLVFSISDTTAYTITTDPGTDDREVIVIDTFDTSLLPDDVLPGDLVYVSSTGAIYKVGA